MYASMVHLRILLRTSTVTSFSLLLLLCATPGLRLTELSLLYLSDHAVL